MGEVGGLGWMAVWVGWVVGVCNMRWVGRGDGGVVGVLWMVWGWLG